MTAILSNINEKVVEYLDDTIKNPILKKVVLEELMLCDTLQTIIKDYFSEKIVMDVSKLKNLTNLINSIPKVSIVKDYKKNNSEQIDFHDNIIKTLGKSFVELSIDEQLYIILNITDDNIAFFKELYTHPTIGQILKHLISTIGLKITSEDDLVKFINACSLIDKNISTELIKNYINLNFADLITSDKILICILKYHNNSVGTSSWLRDEYRKIIGNALKIKVESIKNKIDTMKLDNMEVAYEIYKLGKIIIDSEIKNLPEQEDGYIFKNNIIINFSNEQIEYIVKVIHTCIVNKNIPQTKVLLGIFYYLNTESRKKFMELYNNWLTIRINKFANSYILNTEREIWNFNNKYDMIMKLVDMEDYKRNINNIKYSDYINEDLEKLKVKHSDNVLNMNKVNIKLQNTVDTTEVNLFPEISFYLKGIDAYLAQRAPLQNIVHDTNKSIVTLKTPHGRIKCPLIIASMIMHLNKKDYTSNELAETMKLKEDEIKKRLNILICNNIVVDIGKYKYVEPYGEVECDEIYNVNVKSDIKVSRFTDIELTIDSQIMKVVKANKINKMELERKIQEYLGDEYIRAIYYKQLESLKSRMFIEEKDDTISFIL